MFNTYINHTRRVYITSSSTRATCSPWRSRAKEEGEISGEEKGTYRPHIFTHLACSAKAKETAVFDHLSG